MLNFKENLGLLSFPMFFIADSENIILAQGFSFAIDEYLLLNRNKITTAQMAVEGIKKAQQDYLDSFAKNYLI